MILFPIVAHQAKMMFFELLKQSTYTGCSLPSQIPCKYGHPRCYNISEICVYKLHFNGYIVPCRTGSHLGNCEQFQCNTFYKCPGYYCVRWSYVCDGKWDCPYGYDEALDHNCGFSRQCVNMLRCRKSQICIHVRDICDGLQDCPYKDDEMYCVLKDLKCPIQCTCLNLAITCRGNSFLNERIFRDPYISYHIVGLQFDSLVFLKSTLIVNFVFIQTGLKQVCETVRHWHDLLSINLTCNKITRLQKFCFNNLNILQNIIIKNNKLTRIERRAFVNISKINLIDLSENSLQNLPSLTFVNVSKLGTLIVSQNPLSQITIDNFKSLIIRSIVTSNPLVCCIKPDSSSCITSLSEIYPCTQLFPRLSMKITSITTSIVVLLFNIIPLYFYFCSFISPLKWTQTNGHIHNSYQVLLVAVCFGNLICGIRLVILWTVDLYYSEEFILQQVVWQRSFICFGMYGLNLVFLLTTTYFLFLMSVARLMVVLYPLKSRFKSPNYVTKHVIYGCLAIFSLSGISTVFQYQKYHQLNGSLCSIFVQEGKSNAGVEVTTAFVICLQLGAMTFMSLIYLKLSRKIKELPKKFTLHCQQK